MQVHIVAENSREGGNRTKKMFVVALVFTALTLNLLAPTTVGPRINP